MKPIGHHGSQNEDISKGEAFGVWLGEKFKSAHEERKLTGEGRRTYSLGWGAIDVLVRANIRLTGQEIEEAGFSGPTLPRDKVIVNPRYVSSRLINETLRWDETGYLLRALQLSLDDERLRWNGKNPEVRNAVGRSFAETIRRVPIPAGVTQFSHIRLTQDQEGDYFSTVAIVFCEENEEVSTIGWSKFISRYN